MEGEDAFVAQISQPPRFEGLSRPQNDVLFRYSLGGGVQSSRSWELLVLIEKAGVNVEYMYAFVRQSGQNAVLIFRFDNSAAAAEVLRREGVQVIDGQDLYAM